MRSTVRARTPAANFFFCLTYLQRSAANAIEFTSSPYLGYGGQSRCCLSIVARSQGKGKKDVAPRALSSRGDARDIFPSRPSQLRQDRLLSPVANAQGYVLYCTSPVAQTKCG